MAAWLLSLLLMGATYQYTTAFRAYMDEIDMPDAPPEFVRKRVATTRQENSAFSSEKVELESWAEYLLGIGPKTIDHLHPGYGCNVLHKAAIMGMKDEVAVLLEIGADPNVLTIQGSLSGPRAAIPGSNALLLASENGHTEIVSLLLAAGAAVDVQIKEHGNTALFLAATKGYTRIVQLLLAAKAGIEIRGESGQDTPLTRASFEGHADVVELLLEAGANVSAPTTLTSVLWTGGNALVRAVQGYDGRRGEDVQYLGEDSTTQLEARIVAMLLDAGADSTARDRFGSTPLIVAAASGSVLVVKELLRHRSAAELSINVSTYWEDNTAIGYAAFNGFVEIAKVLLDAGADPSVKNRKGMDAMDLARTPTPHMRSEPQWWLDLERFYADLEAAARVEKPDYMCSITNEIMRNPAALVDGDVFQHVYEYDAIALWMTDNCIDPSSGVSIDPTRCALIRDKRLEREIRSWCEDKALSWRIQLDSGSEAPMPRRSLHVFVDHSNVAAGAARLGKQLDVMHLVRHVEGLRDVKERVVIGSHEAERARHEWERHGYSVSADSRHGPERFVDDALHAQLMRTAAKAFDPPRVIALVTGDGNRNDGRTNFPECVEEALRQRWHVELYSWRQQTSNVYAVLAEQYAGHFCICYLDDKEGLGSGAASTSVAWHDETYDEEEAEGAHKQHAPKKKASKKTKAKQAGACEARAPVASASAAEPPKAEEPLRGEEPPKAVEALLEATAAAEAAVAESAAAEKAEVAEAAAAAAAERAAKEVEEAAVRVAAAEAVQAAMAELERVEVERAQVERAEVERAEAERAEAERAEAERAEAERAEAERAEAERAEAERAE
eukprot:jgi/Chrpa1/11264/Chrysochromulina_OHIO_Genome00005102-RA